MGGWRGGWHGRWHGRGWGRFQPPVGVKGYRYVGPCRCGWGPHAYYVDERGNLVHAWDLFGEVDELEALKRQKEAIERRIRELESKRQEA